MLKAGIIGLFNKVKSWKNLKKTSEKYKVLPKSIQ